MRFSWIPAWTLLLAVVLILMPTAAAHAYLDPGSGSLIVQIIVAGILGLLVAIKVYWTRIMNFIMRRKPEAEPSESSGDEAP